MSSDYFNETGSNSHIFLISVSTVLIKWHEVKFSLICEVFITPGNKGFVGNADALRFAPRTCDPVINDKNMSAPKWVYTSPSTKKDGSAKIKFSVCGLLLCSNVKLGSDVVTFFTTNTIKLKLKIL